MQEAVVKCGEDSESDIERKGAPKSHN